MSTQHLRNVPLNLYRKFLEDQGCKCNRKKGGHEHWSRIDLNKPITLQSHITPVPEFIIKNGLKILELSKQDFLDWI